MENLRIIIVDDEVLIRKLIRMKMDAKRIGLEIVGEFSNAASALAELDALHPDLIISDICMPELDGISFSEQCTMRLPEVKIIILTGYSDFEYARRCLKVGVFDYLMKPVQAEEINRTLEKASELVRQERAQNEKQRKILEEREQTIPLLRNTYIGQLLIGKDFNADIEEKLRDYGVPVESCCKYGLQVGVLAIHESVQEPQILGTLKNEAEQFFQSDERLYVVIDAWGRLVFIAEGKNTAFRDCLNIFAQYVKQKWNYRLLIGMAEKCNSWKELRKGYVQALEDLHYKYEESKIQESESADKDVSRVSIWNKVINEIQRGNVDATIAATEQVIKTKTWNKQEVYYLFQKISSATGCEKVKIDGYKRLDYCECNEDLIRCMRSVIRNFAMEYAMSKEGEKGILMGNIIQYMKENIKNPELSVNTLMAEFSVSSSFLSRLFKTCTGTSYSEFLSELRFWRLLEQLTTDGRMRDRDIGTQIGIRDPHYMSIWFRKATGYSFTEYRKMRNTSNIGMIEK